MLKRFAAIGVALAVVILMWQKEGVQNAPVKSRQTIRDNSFVFLENASSLSDDRNIFPDICTHPILMKIGTIDPQFKFSSSQVLTAIQTAAQEWEDATGRKWFTLSAGGNLTVNLLFDGRQSEVLERQKVANDLEREFAEATAKSNLLRAQLRSGLSKEESVQKLSELNNLKLSLQNRLAEFNARFASSVPIPCGQHENGWAGESIDIFSFAGPSELHHTLLHELGHAIGLGHLPQPDSIMYATFNSSNPTEHLSAADVDAAISLCEKR